MGYLQAEAKITEYALRGMQASCARYSMSFVVQYILICDIGKDGCEGTFANGDCVDIPRAEQRDRAMREGWVRIDSKDCCASCARAFRNGDTR